MTVNDIGVASFPAPSRARHVTVLRLVAAFGPSRKTVPEARVQLTRGCEAPLPGSVAIAASFTTAPLRLVAALMTP